MIGSDREILMAEPLKIIFWPDPRLKRASQPVKGFDIKLRELVSAMLELMRAEKGVGLAAPQVGRNIRLFVMNATGEPGDDRVYVNPSLFDPEGEETGEEGCLSIPTFREPVTRAQKVTVRAKDATGKEFEMTGEDLLARAFQHETDHLNGTLYISHVSPLKRDLIRRKIRKLQKAGEWG